MRFAFWTEKLRQRMAGLSRRRCARRGSPDLAAAQPAERMESRILPAVSVLLNDDPFDPALDDLTIQMNSNDDVTVTVSGGFVQILTGNGGGPQTVLLGAPQTLTPASLARIDILGSDDSNRFVINGVTTANGFSASLIVNVEGSDSNDLLDATSSDIAVSLVGGNGNDTITGGIANDTLLGGDGADLITGGVGNDSLLGGNGADTVNGGVGLDTLNGGDGADSLNAGDDADSVFGGNGADNIDGGLGDDTLNGDGGNDTINGNLGNDTLLGGADQDSLLGGDGDDSINAQAGNDTILGEVGNDTLFGGDGTDSVAGGADADTISGDAGNDTMLGDAGNDSLLGGSGNDSINGGDGDDTSLGQSGNDTLISGTGADSLDGGAGNDLLDSRVAQLSVDNVQVQEGNSGTTQLTFTVSLSIVLGVTVTVEYATSSDGTQTGGTATAGSDYTASSSATNGALTFAPGQVSRQITVSVLGDVLAESDETFFITLSNAVNAAIFDGSGEGRILNDDGAGGLQPTVYPGGGTITPVGPHQFSTGTGDASVNLGVDGYGSYGSRLSPNGTNATYDPVGPTTPAGTTWESGLAFRVGNAGPRQFLTSGSISGSGGLVRPAITGTTTDSISTFAQSGLNFSLAQSVDPLNDNSGVRTGSILTQTYTITNPSAAAISFELIRFMEGDLLFDGSFFADGGGRLFTAAGDELLFETDAGGTGATSTTFVGISSIGGTIPGTNRYEINRWPAFGNRLVNGNPLGDVINGDTDGDGFVDAGNEFDAGLALRNTFSLTAGATTTYTTHTLWGTGIPGSVGNAPPPPAPPAPPPTGGDNDTLLGSDGNDTLLAGTANDLINGGSGNDSIDAGPGNDTVFGGAGGDTLQGGDGNDSLNGQGGNDVIDGGAGDDQLVWTGASGASDTVSGSTGFDTAVVTGTGTADTFDVGQNASGQMTVTDSGFTLTIQSTITNVVINANAGDDVVTIGSLNKVTGTVLTINGGDGNDNLDASGAVLGFVRMGLNGQAGDDTLTGGDGTDTLDGGDGNDALAAGAGNDSVIGGAGDDVLSGQDGNDTLNGGDGDDFASGGNGNDSVRGGDGNDTLQGQAGNDSLTGEAGDDSLVDTTGNDSLTGGNGFDTLDSGDGNDTLDGGFGDDSLTAGAGSDKLRGGDGNDTLDAGDGDDELNGGDGDDQLIGGTGNDGLSGGDGDDLINGGAGNDVIAGNDGNDSLLGGSGADTLLGGDGDDSINGQGGADIMAGNEGIDTLASDASDSVNELFALSQTLLDKLDGV